MVAIQGAEGGSNPAVWNAAAEPLQPYDYTLPGETEFWEKMVPKIGLEPGSDFATPYKDFTPVMGTLEFGDNVMYQTFDIPILNDDLVEFNEDLFIYL